MGAEDPKQRLTYPNLSPWMQKLISDLGGVVRAGYSLTDPSQIPSQPLPRASIINDGTSGQEFGRPSRKIQTAKNKFPL